LGLPVYIISRIMNYLLVIFVAVTLCFVIPRVTGSSPIETVINRLTAYGEYYDPITLQGIIESLKELYGLKGSLWEQYITFLKRLFTLDLGPSLTEFPTPVSVLINRSLPWTIGLLSITTLISWLFAIFIGGIAGYFEESKIAKFLTGFSIVVHNIPYYILGLCFILLFSYLIPLFPAGGGYSVGTELTFSIRSILDVLYHAILPALSLIIVSYGGGFIIMRGLSITTKNEEYTKFAEIMHLNKNTILYKYIIRNSLLPQVTGLAISLGNIFTGSLALEVVFSYPGLGSLLYRALITSDYNLIMGITIYSIFAITTSLLILDFIYPFIDPRIRYR